jgi:hypothetical protein
MADTVACRCPGNCGLHGELCGKPVEKPLDVAPVDEGMIGQWYKTGLCEQCWNALKAAGKL